MDLPSSCSVCRKAASKFHGNLTSLKTKCSARPIREVIQMILNKETTTIRSSDRTAIVCTPCLQRINEYDESQVKMQQIQRELNLMHANPTCNEAVRNETNERDAGEDEDSDVGDGGSWQKDDEHADDGTDLNDSNYLLVPLEKTFQNIKCSICEQSFDSHSSLTSHRQNCVKPKIKKASPSIKRAKAPAAIKIVKNKTANVLRCKYCCVKFVDNDTLAEHEKRHMNRPALQCVECDMIFKAKGHFIKHMLVHTKEKLHQCDICGKEFSHATSFKMHIRSHMDDRRVECYMCIYRTLSMCQLRRHMRIHTGEKPFVCEHCGKGFARSCNRTAHARTHFEPTRKPHKCTTCDSAFTRIGKLTEHYQKVHGLTIQKASNRLFKVNPAPTI